MAIEINMPKLSDTMEEGTLISWKKSVGERVERGDIIAEVETDKANMELEAFASGVLLEIRVKSGEQVPVGTVIALIGEAGEEVAAKPAPESVSEREPEPVPEDGAVKESPPEQRKNDVPAEREVKQTVEEPVASRSVEDKASPLVRRMARELGVALHDVPATGPEGRILREDLERFQEEGQPAEKRTEAPPLRSKSAAPVSGGKPQPLSRMRAAIARTVSASWRSIPHFSVSVAINMGAAESLYRGFREAGVSLTINDMIVKGAAMALQKFPNLNAAFTDDGVIYHPEINIGMAVSVDGGLLVPVVKGCSQLTLKEIAVKSRELIARARDGKISETDISGGTFSVSNLGMFGVETFSAVIYPSQAAILAVAAIRDTVVAGDGRFDRARVMTVTLSADHRLVDGVDAARFLAELRKVLENPAMMLV
jgi:pyruvate dehydrogenase E2 component (dihydrolipoamide acetyltransferase)